ncbi:hypothetical protein ALGA_4236 [Labilibaculum antarcticum]|uniref:Uncharacterized protein n=2 Tax=Labilibaculum antarcticum TaxID=1717717 RepID=A0A1Y1CQ31_9BACT|nr:hypothetical protein ALGA_4236 [Labilibaculum antarcticum]
MTSCLDDSDDVYFHEHKQSILLLQVDYTSYEFEKGTELFLHAEYSDADTIPIGVDYDPPGDFGNIRLFYEPSKECIFNGSIVWAGTGHLRFPKWFYYPSQFATLEIPVEKPVNDEFQIIFPEEGLEYPLDSIWNAVNHLSIVSRYLESGKKIGVFRYTPSVGVGDPNEWDWYVIMNTN